MKKLMSLMILVGMIFAAGVAKAQVAPLFEEVRANVPFEFHAGDTMFPAGGIVIKRLNPMEPQILAISTADGGYTALFLAHLSGMKQEAKTSELVFHKYGNAYFLASINIEGYASGMELGRSRDEETTARTEIPTEGRRVAARPFE